MSDWRLSDRADADLSEIYLYGREMFGRRQALAYVESLGSCFDLLSAHPRMGRPADDIGPGVRRFEHQRHVALYEQTTEGVLILAIVHERSVHRLIL